MSPVFCHHWSSMTPYEASLHAYPEKRERRMRLKLWGRMLIQTRLYRELMVGLDADQLLQAAVARRRTLLVKPFRTYITTRYTARQRLEHLLGHYALQRQYLGDSLSASVLDGIGLPLMRLTVGDQAVDFVLGYRGLHDREGELMLMLLDGLSGKRLYSAAFSLMSDPGGTASLCLGTLQGNRDQADWIKAFARQYHGLRPQAFMLEALLMLARIWGVAGLVTVDNAHHVYRARKRTAAKRRFDLDALVAGFGGKASADGWFRLGLDDGRRSIEEIASRKRSQYRKRYAWLASMETQLGERLAPTEPAISCPGSRRREESHTVVG